MTASGTIKLLLFLYHNERKGSERVWKVHKKCCITYYDYYLIPFP